MLGLTLQLHRLATSRQCEFRLIFAEDPFRSELSARSRQIIDGALKNRKERGASHAKMWTTDNMSPVWLFCAQEVIFQPRRGKKAVADTKVNVASIVLSVAA